jgi:small-conductance mechanosensitive channel
MVGTVLSLYIAGISFAGVAIAVGALLVGVGFGLQNIVSDFVAGLVLLTNSVVRLGDYILIGDVEGVVKKIRLLSTEIRTSYPSTVLVPNSSLMNTHLVNYTDQGKVLYIKLQIVIESIADVEIAKEIVLQVATKNTDVINNEQNKPSVLIEVYESYGKIAVHLVLNAAISSTGNRALILSELSSAVLNAFKQRCLQVQVSG